MTRHPIWSLVLAGHAFEDTTVIDIINHMSHDTCCQAKFRSVLGTYFDYTSRIAFSFSFSTHRLPFMVPTFLVTSLSMSFNDLPPSIFLLIASQLEKVDFLSRYATINRSWNSVIEALSFRELRSESISHLRQIPEYLNTISTLTRKYEYAIDEGLYRYEIEWPARMDLPCRSSGTAVNPDIFNDMYLAVARVMNRMPNLRDLKLNVEAAFQESGCLCTFTSDGRSSHMVVWRSRSATMYEPHADVISAWKQIFEERTGELEIQVL